MGISAGLGTGGLTPGVCTSSTRPTAPFEGQMIYETDTDLTYIYSGLAWQQFAGSTAVGNSGLVYVAATTGTAASNIAVNSCFSSTYTNYRVVIAVVSSANTNLNMKLRSGTTDKSANYRWGAFYLDMDSGSPTLNPESSGGAITGGFRVAATNLAGITTSFVDVGNPYVSGRTTAYCLPQSTESYFRLMSNYHNEDYSANGINVIPSSGTITGTVTVYGYRN